MSKDTKKKIIWAFVSLFLAGLCIWLVIRGSGELSLETLRAKLENANPVLMMLSALSMFGFIFFEALAMHALLKDSGYRKKKRYCITYAAADVFVSAITPSASGGQPASAFFMMLDGIPGTVSTVV